MIQLPCSLSSLVVGGVIFIWGIMREQIFKWGLRMWNRFPILIKKLQSYSTRSKVIYRVFKFKNKPELYILSGSVEENFELKTKTFSASK